MSTFLSILTGIAVWIAIELMWMALTPIHRPITRAISRSVNRWTVAALWIGALASYPFLPYSMDAASRAVQVLGFAAFMGLTPLALMGTFGLRHRRAMRRAYTG